MEPLTREQLGRLLDRVTHLYPGGVPRAALVAPEPVSTNPVEQNVQPQAEFDVGYVVPSPGPLPSSLSTLLESITLKGLSLDVSRTTVTVCDVADPDALQVAVYSLATAGSCRVVIVLGGTQEVAPGAWRDEHGTPTLYTKSLAEIEADKLAKREFWGHLQGVLGKLGKR